MGSFWQRYYRKRAEMDALEQAVMGDGPLPDSDLLSAEELAKMDAYEAQRRGDLHVFYDDEADVWVAAGGDGLSVALEDYSLPELLRRMADAIEDLAAHEWRDSNIL